MSKRDAFVLVTILAVALAARVWVLIAFPDIDPYRGDGRRYVTEARNIFTGGTYAWNRSPGYCAILAIPHYLLGFDDVSRPLFQGTNVVLGLLAVAGVYAVGRLIHGHRLGAIAAALVAIDPRYVTHAIFPIIENGYIPLCIWSLAAVIWAIRKPTVRRAVLAGTLLGLATLTRSFMTYFIVVAGGMTLVLGTGRLRSRLVPSALIVVSALLTILPWTIRNWDEYHRFVPVSFEDGAQFVRGNVLQRSDYADIARQVKNDLKRGNRNARPDDPPRAVQVDMNSAMRERGIELILQRQPGWIAEKIWKYGPVLLKPGGYALGRGLQDPDVVGAGNVVTIRRVFLGTQTVILLLAAVGFARHTRGAGDVVLILYLLYSFGIHVTTHISPIRYQLPYNWILILYAARVFADHPAWTRWRVVAVGLLSSVAVASLVVNAARAPSEADLAKLAAKKERKKTALQAQKDKEGNFKGRGRRIRKAGQTDDALDAGGLDESDPFGDWDP